MHIIKILLCSVIFGLGSAIFVYGQVTKNIIPMHSNCEDVKKILGVETCRKNHEFYDLKSEKIEISYSTENCQKAYLKEWNIPIGTVLSVIKIFKKAVALEDMQIDLGVCEIDEDISDTPGLKKYYCEKIGTSFSVYDGYVSEIIYTSTPDDSNLLCSASRQNDKCP